MRNIERLRKLPKNWKIAAITPNFKKRDKRLVEIYRTVSLLNIDCQVFKECFYRALFDHFVKFLTKHGFVRRTSVPTNMLSFLQKIYEALDRTSNDDITVFYSDFSKASDKVPHNKFIQKMSQMGVRGCYSDVLYDYLENMKQFI